MKSDFYLLARLKTIFSKLVQPENKEVSGSEVIKVDFVMSVGTACRCAQALRRNGLRVQSSPFDWMMAYDITVISHFFLNGLDDFFLDKQDLKHDISGKRMVKDIKTGMISMHDFPVSEEIDNFYPVFIEKMKIRMEKIKSKIERSRDICFVNYGRPDERRSINSFLHSMHELYPHLYIHFLNIENRDCFGISIREEYISDFCHIRQCFFRDVHKDGDGDRNPNAWIGNEQCWDEVLKQISLRQ